MILSNKFLIETSVDRAWDLFNDLERVVPCMPGAAFLGTDGTDSQVSIKVKIGAISSSFIGNVRFVEKNQAAYMAVIQGTGKDAGGKGSASARIVSRLHPLNENLTEVVVETDLALSGRVAQFGGPIVGDIASRLVGRFADNLHRAIINVPSANQNTAPSEGARTHPFTAPVAPPVAEPAALDLGAAMFPVLTRYALKHLAVPVGCLVIGWVIGHYF